MDTEQQWLDRAARGDAAAFEQLVLRYQKPVYNLALRMTGNPDDALDLSQEAFVRAWRSLKELRSGAAFSTWLYRLTSNLCIDFLRSAKRRPAASLTAAEQDEQMDVPDPAPSPEQRVLRQLDQERLRQAMDALPVEYRQILTLRVINGLSYLQIAQILDVAEGTVKSRLSRARECLRKNLSDDGNEPPKAASNPIEGRKRRGL